MVDMEGEVGHIGLVDLTVFAAIPRPFLDTLAESRSH